MSCLYCVKFSEFSLVWLGNFDFFRKPSSGYPHWDMTIFFSKYLEKLQVLEQKNNKKHILTKQICLYFL